MVSTAPPPTRNAGFPQALDRANAPLSLEAGRLPWLAPNEHLEGTPSDVRRLADRLSALRAAAALHQSHSGVRFSLLSWYFDSLPSNAQRIFAHGASLIAERYEQLGLTHLLPTDRVWVGVSSANPGEFGGFHHRDQGYRHMQMGAVVTRYGDLAHPGHTPPELVAADLLRAYAHDTLHYGSYREYRLAGGEIVRTRYGINSRDAHGNTYSAPDPPESGCTRNLGILMEGATDHEATTITRRAVELAGAVEPAGHVERFAWRDVTGLLADEDIAALPPHPSGSQAVGVERYLSSMGWFARNVTSRYVRFREGNTTKYCAPVGKWRGAWGWGSAPGWAAD